MRLRIQQQQQPTPDRMYIGEHARQGLRRRKGRLLSYRNICLASLLLALLGLCGLWALAEVRQHVASSHRPVQMAEPEQQRRSMDGERPPPQGSSWVELLRGAAEAESERDSCASLPGLLERGFEALDRRMAGNIANLLAHVQQVGDDEARTRNGLHTIERALIRLAEVADSSVLVGGAAAAGHVLEERLCFDLRDCPVPDCRCPPCVCAEGQLMQRGGGSNGICPACPTSLVKLTRSGEDEHIVALPKLATLEAPTGTFYVVTGVESSGNRYLVSMLIAAGCVGMSSHVQPWDQPGSSYSTINAARLVQEGPRCAVVHRSFPHSAQWPNLRNLFFQIQEANYRPRVIYITRNQLAVVQSQLRVSHVLSSASAENRIQKGKRQIWGYIASTNVWFLEVLYERLSNMDYVSYIYQQMEYRGGAAGEIPAGHPPFRDANFKYESLMTG